MKKMKVFCIKDKVKECHMVSLIQADNGEK